MSQTGTNSPKPLRGPTLLDKLKSIFPPKPEWTPENIPSLTGKVCVVTGGNTGIGKETCKWLLLRGAFVYLAARSEDKARAAMDDLVRWVVSQSTTAREEEVRTRLKFIKVDLAHCKSVRVAAQQILEQERNGRLDILFCSAGVLAPANGSRTADGLEKNWGTNVLGHGLLTMELLPLLLSTITKPDTPKGSVRVVTTSSSAHYLFPVIGGIMWENKSDGTVSVGDESKLSVMQLYAQSKTGNIVFAYELARRYADKGLVSIVVNPGSIRTELDRDMSNFMLQLLGKILLYPVHMGPFAQLFAGTAPEASELNGKYLEPWGRVSNSTIDSQNPEYGPKLWDYIVAESAKHL